MLLFYQPRLDENYTFLDEEESRHCSRVLRLGIGSEIFVTDGKGNLYRAEISEIRKHITGFQVIEKTKGNDSRRYSLHVGIAPTKNTDRLEWFLEKATEIGIDEITPLQCEHSERKHINQERLEKVMVSAMKQSLKTVKPVLHALTPFSQFISNSSTDTKKLIAHCHNGDKSLISYAIQGVQNISVLIGPEGDFSEQEVEDALQLGWRPVSFGETRLRTETAGVLACASAYLQNLGKL